MNDNSDINYLYTKPVDTETFRTTNIYISTITSASNTLTFTQYSHYITSVTKPIANCKIIKIVIKFSHFRILLVRILCSLYLWGRRHIIYYVAYSLIL